MRILLDENVPIDILPVLRSEGHAAQSVNFIGWKGLENGELLVKPRQEFELLLTRDKDFNANELAREVSPRFGIVLLGITQQPGPGYAIAFTRIWPADASSLIGRVTRHGD